MFEAESVRMIVLVPAYATSAASFETSGFKVFAICSASMYESGISSRHEAIGVRRGARAALACRSGFLGVADRIP